MIFRRSQIMALKMRFLYASKQAKMKALGMAIKQEFDLSANNNAVDIIPPAYSCDIYISVSIP